MPTSIDFIDSDDAFVVTTLSLRMIKFDLPELKHKDLFRDNEKIVIKNWHVRYPYQNNNFLDYLCPTVLGMIEL